MGSSARSLFARCDRNIVWLAAKQGPDAAEWSAYIDEVVRLGNELPDKLVQILVVTDGGGPSSVQRTDFVGAMGDVRVRTAVLSCNTFVRGIATVFNWFNVLNKVFAPKDVTRALEFVGVGETTRGSMWSTVEGLARQLDGVETVRLAKPFLRKGAGEEMQAR
jgi:hypothetical protein